MSSYKVVYSEYALGDIARLDPAVRVRIRRAIEGKLTDNPELHGKPLHHPLSGMWTLRVNDWRITFAVRGMTVTIFAVFHRSTGYPKR